MQKVVLKETDLFQPVKEWLEQHGYTVYSEVQAKDRHNRADVVGVRGPVITVVELKTSLSLDLIGQAFHWLHRAHYVYVAIPRPKQYNHFARDLLRREGIGVLEIGSMVTPGTRGTERCFYVDRAAYCLPRMRRQISPDLKRALTDHHLSTIPGGSAGGGYLTDYKLTMIKVRQFLSWPGHNGKWVSIREILDHHETHYLHPKDSLAKALLAVEADWCEAAKIDRTWHFRVRQPEASD